MPRRVGVDSPVRREVWKLSLSASVCRDVVGGRVEGRSRKSLRGGGRCTGLDLEVERRLRRTWRGRHRHVEGDLRHKSDEERP